MESKIKTSQLITVVITTYNRPDTLRQTIQSVLDQTYKNLEILVIDDCSLGNEINNLIKDLQRIDNRISFYKQSQNRGFEENLNYYVKLAKGEFFLWLNDDDWIDNFYIEKCLNYKLKNPAYVVVSGKTKFYHGEKFDFYGEIINIEEESSSKRVLSFLDKQLGTGNCPNFGIMRTRDILNLPLKKILGHDNVRVANIAYLGKIKILEDVYIHRRLGGSSENLKKSAISGRYSNFELNFPFIALWKNIFVDIAWEGKVYKPLGLFKRLILALSVTGLIIFKMGEYFKRYKKRQHAPLRQKL